MPSCLCVYVCACVGKKKLKNALSRVAKVFLDVIVNKNNQHNQIRTILYLIQIESRWFFTLLFQLLPITGFVAPPLLKLHVVVTVSNATRTPVCKNTGRIDLATQEEAHGVSIP